MLATAEPVDEGSAVTGRIDHLDDVRLGCVRRQERCDDGRKFFPNGDCFAREFLFTKGQSLRFNEPAVFRERGLHDVRVCPHRRPWIIAFWR